MTDECVGDGVGCAPVSYFSILFLVYLFINPTTPKVSE
jgi:hypothetical protein